MRYSIRAFWLFFLLLSPLSPTASPSWPELERQFRELPPEARRLTGPLFWLHGDDSKERLEMYVGKVAEGGNGAFTAESRPHNDWLGPNWYRDLEICLNTAKQHSLKLWIFDEKWWPSQGVAGKVPPRYAAKNLAASAVEVTGPRAFEADGFSGQRYIATVAGQISQDGTIDPATLVDLASFIDPTGKLSWPAPAGRWQIMKFTHEQAPGLGQGGGTQLSVDGASQDCVEWFLNTVYQPHYERFKEEFGKTIVGFFYDEPETRGDWGTELNAVLAEFGVDWKQAYVAYKFKLSGETQAAARYQYLDARAEAWGRTMYGGITRWCEQRGVKSIGHFMEHAGMYRLQDFCAGDLMRVQKYSSMGGIDAVFSQFKWGQRAAYDAPCWQTPKLGSSITHAYGKIDDVTMCEIFGARGQDLTYPEMKWWVDHMQVSGVNFMIPHSFNPRAPHDTDCPPYFYNGGFEPRWPLYRVFADYTSRLSLMLSGGRHVAPVALLSPGQSLHVGNGVPLDQISEALQDALYDCDWLPYEVFERDTALAGSQIKLRDESYRVLVIPPVDVIPHATMLRAKAFFEDGGVVVGHEYLPSKSATVGKSSKEIAEINEAIWGTAKPSLKVCKTNPAGGRSYFLPAKPNPPQLQQVLAEDAQLRPTLEIVGSEKGDGWLHVLHRVKEGRDLFFIANQNHQGPSRTFRSRIRAEGFPEAWDAMRNEITAVRHSRNGPEAEVNLALEPNESVLLVFQSEKRTLPERKEGPHLPRTIPIQDVKVTPMPEPQLDQALTSPFEGCSWVWHPEGNPAQSAPAGPRYFRKQIVLPTDRAIRSAMFHGTADNHFSLFVNGKEAGQGDSSPEGWRNPVALDVTQRLQPGTNQLAIIAVNAASDRVNPAGLLGCVQIEFKQGPMLTVPVDRTWKSSIASPPRWTETTFDDSAWLAAKEAAPFGAGPWGRLGRNQLTLSPVKGKIFIGYCDLPVSSSSKRFFLQLRDLGPEEAARVTINNQYAGGFIGKPLRLEVTSHLKRGRNSIRLEPFIPNSVELLEE